MRILKLLNSIYFLIFIALFSTSNLSLSNEPEDIWNIENLDKDEKKSKVEKLLIEDLENKKLIPDKNEGKILLEEENSKSVRIDLIGLYDPVENDLNINMWEYSDGDQLKNIFKKIDKISLSKDSSKILKVALLTNAYLPKYNIDSQEFIDYKINFLLKNNDQELIKNFLLNNKNVNGNNKLIRNYVDFYLLDGNLDESCDLLYKLKNTKSNIYIDKFKIYCLLNDKKFEEALLNYDLIKETGFNDIFFEKIFNILIGYNQKQENIFSEESILNFHLSHKSSPNFEYTPDEKTPKYIWKYLSNYNLLESMDDIDLENQEKILVLEKATHQNNYSEKELLRLYQRFQFTFNELLNAEESFKSLKSFKGRALLYQKLLLTGEISEKILLAEKLKKSMEKDKIENAYKDELSELLKKTNIEDIPSNLTTFYYDNLIVEEIKNDKIKFNNKIIHQSKLLNYFTKNYNTNKISKETNEMLKKVKADKDYMFSTKDKMLLDSIRYDGALIKKKYENLYSRNPNIPTDLQVLVNNDDIGMILLRLVEIIGEDNIEDLGSETQYFVITVLNEINLDKIRNEILLKILPLKV